jgi:hypothetical protein
VTDPCSRRSAVAGGRRPAAVGDEQPAHLGARETVELFANRAAAERAGASSPRRTLFSSFAVPCASGWFTGDPRHRAASSRRGVAGTGGARAREKMPGSPRVPGKPSRGGSPTGGYMRRERRLCSSPCRTCSAHASRLHVPNGGGAPPASQAFCHLVTLSPCHPRPENRQTHLRVARERERVHRADADADPAADAA